MDKKIYFALIILSSFFYAVVNLSPTSYAQTCTTCGNGSYACGTGCCTGGGCPSAVCGVCPWGWISYGGNSYCVNPNTGDYDICNATCGGCPGSGQGNCSQSCQRGCSNGTQGAWCGISGNGYNQYWCTQCGNPPPPPPPPTATVSGKVWSDDNGNGTLQNSEHWGVPSISSCVTGIGGHLSSILNYTAAVTWACSGSLPQWTVSGQPVNSVFSRTLVPPKNHFCSQTTWTGTVCTNASCSTKNNFSGSGCTATLAGLNVNPNSLLYRVRYDAPPTGTITYPIPTSDHIMSDGTVVLNRTVTQSFTGNANSPNSDLSGVTLEYRPYDPVSKLDVNPATVFGTRGGSGANLSVASSITIPGGYYSYYVRGSEAIGNYCVGRFALDPASQNRCDVDTNPATTDRVAIYGDTPPACSTTYGSYSWPIAQAGADMPMQFSSNAPDINGTAVNYAWSATCGRYPNIKMVRVNAIGRNVGGNRPRMTLLITRPNGTRASYGPITTTSSAATNYDFNVNVDGATMIEVAYDNDFTAGSNSTSLQVNSIALYEDPAGTPLTTVAAATSTVFYDPANTNNPGITADYYDGINSVGTPASVTNTGNMLANGLIRFPSVWVTPTVEQPSCTVGLTPTVASPFYNGNACSVTFTSTVRTVSGTLYDTTEGGTASCTSPTTVTGSSATVQLYNGTTLIGTPAPTTTGTYTVTPLYQGTVFNSLCVNGVLGDGSKAYSYSCYNSPQLTCTPGSGNCLLNCTPTNALATGDITLNIGFNSAENDKWFTVLDGDFYSSNVSAYVSIDPGDDFTSNIINTQTSTGSSVGGFGFAGGSIDTQTTGSTVSELGGFSSILNSVGSYNFEDKWLNGYSFTSPLNPVTDVPAGNDFEDGKVYRFTNEQITDVLAEGSYNVSGVGSNPKVAIIFVEETETISIDESFTAPDGQMLVLVTQAPVEIDSSLSVPSLVTYTVNSASQVDLVLLSKEDITFRSDYDQGSAIYDDPVVLNGSLISRSQINLDRNLGGANNSLYPSTNIRYISALLARIAQMEIISNTSINSTGISKFDLQWNYGN